MGDKELSRLGKDAVAAAKDAKTNGLNADNIGRVTNATEGILDRTRELADQYSSQGLTDAQIRQKIAEDLQNSR